MATSTEARPWQAEILDELGQAQLDGLIADTHTHAAIWLSEDRVDSASTQLLGTAESELAAIVIAEDKSAGMGHGEARVVKLDDLQAWSKANAEGGELPAVEGPILADASDSDATDEGEKTEEDDEPLVDATGQTAIIDRSQYEREDLQIAKIDGESIDSLLIKGQVQIRLNRSDPSDVAVFNQIKLGREVSLLIEAKCIGTGATGTTNKDGDLDVVAGVKTLKVHSISKPAGADWITDTTKASA